MVEWEAITCAEQSMMDDDLVYQFSLYKLLSSFTFYNYDAHIVHNPKNQNTAVHHSYSNPGKISKAK